MSRVRRWCFTLHHYSGAELDWLKSGEIPDLRYMVCGEEMGAEDKTPHLQGYAEFTKALTMGQVKSALKSDSVHLETAKGNARENEAYCAKEGKSWTRGTPAAPGTRNDLRAVTEGLKAGTGIRTMVLDGTIGGKAALGFAEAVAKYVEPERDWLPEVQWFWGPPGAGKSRAAREWLNDPEARYVKTSGSGKWWDGYDGHPDILWDDFRDSQCPLTDLLGLLDRYGHRLEIKGGMRQCLARRIAITSIQPPSDMFAHAKGEPVGQLLRRLTHVHHVQRLGGNTDPQP